MAALVKRKEFTAWVKEEKIREGLILVNNSFIYRQGSKTNKNPLYLGIPVASNGDLDAKGIKVTRGINFNTDFKFVPMKTPPRLHVENLQPAVDAALRELGSIVMVLIGEVHDMVMTTEPIGHELFSELQLDPTAGKAMALHGRTITVNSVTDDEALWDSLEKLHGENLPESLAEPFATAVENVRRKHYAVLKLPVGSHVSHPLLDTFVDALRDNLARYKKAFATSKGIPAPHANEFNDLLRIAYNFASDAVLVIRLLVGVCDLKPVVRWCTLDEWFRLADAFKNLPWSKLKQKPSLDAYQHTINAARNRAFHRLLPVNNTLQVELGGETLGKVTLRLFPEYLKHKSEQNMDYEDRALVEILADFTRVSERSVSAHFWERNADVMESTVDLLARSSSALKLLSQS